MLCTAQQTPHGANTKGATMARKSTTKLAPEFIRVRDFIRRYCLIEDGDLTLVTTWAMGTHCFSPACRWPFSWSYLYITGLAGGGKTTLGDYVLGCLCRDHTSATGTTGSTLFRMLGIFDEETGEIENLAPTLFLDEIDTTYSGSKDPDLTRSLDVGYKRGATIPRSAGKSYVAFPVYGPKILMGIENGHLPQPLLTRCLHIPLERKTKDELDAAGIVDFLDYKVEEEKVEIQQELNTWAKAHSEVFREYDPESPKGLTGRQWELSRSLIQLAHAIGNEDEVVKALIANFNRTPERPDHKVELYQTIFELFETQGGPDADRLSSHQIIVELKRRGIQVPGQSMKGLAAALSQDGVSPDIVRFKDGHPEFTRLLEVKKAKQAVAAGYHRYRFDGPFVRFLPFEDEEEEIGNGK